MNTKAKPFKHEDVAAREEAKTIREEPVVAKEKLSPIVLCAKFSDDPHVDLYPEGTVEVKRLTSKPYIVLDGAQTAAVRTHVKADGYVLEKWEGATDLPNGLTIHGTLVKSGEIVVLVSVRGNLSGVLEENTPLIKVFPE